jgi:hypothetical protein
MKLVAMGRQEIAVPLTDSASDMAGRMIRLFTLRLSILRTYSVEDVHACSQSHRLCTLMGSGVPQNVGWGPSG